MHKKDALIVDRTRLNATEGLHKGSRGSVVYFVTGCTSGRYKKIDQYDIVLGSNYGSLRVALLG
jgi:hypothetical protein